jgi:predicted GTPase
MVMHAFSWHKAFIREDDKPVKSNHNSLADEINETIDAGEHLEFIRNLIQRHCLSEAKQQYFWQQLDLIERRINDSTLYLTVIGEFSSGKSTFINGLLRKRLLKASRVATTASATYITYGDTFKVKVTFVDDRCVEATESQTGFLYEAIANLEKSLPQNPSLQQLIDLLTSNQNVADRVQKIEISLPEDSLKSGLTIIDTPGIGAGADYTTNHANVTRKEIANAGDTAIILIPASSPLSNTLITFLQTTVKHLLHRCLFVITAMDNQEEEERKEIVSYVKQKLESKLSLTNPVVLESAAITMLPISQIPASKLDIWSYWQHQFQALESLLLREMNRQRKVIILERLVYLLQQILAELNLDLTEKQQRLNEEAQTLNANSVVAIETVLERLFEQSAERISRQGNTCKSQASSKSHSFRSQLKTKVREIISQADWDKIKDYSTTIEPQIKQLAEATGKNFLTQVNSDLEQIKHCCKTVSEEFQQQFEQNYQNLKALGVSITTSSIDLSSITLDRVNFSSPQSFVEEAKDRRGRRRNWGAVIGGTAGLVLLGPIGAAAGASLGSRIGANSSGEIDTYRQGVWSEVESDLDNYIDLYLSQTQSAIDGFVKRAIRDFKIAVEAHLTEYGTVVSDLIAQHQQQQQQLKSEIGEIDADSQELSYRKDKLVRLRSSLLQVGLAK